MKILPIAINNINIPIISSGYIPFLSAHKKDSFTLENDERNLCEDFRQKMNAIYPNQKPEAALREIISDSDNRIGEGREKIVYKIPGIDNFVIGKIKKAKPSLNELKPLENKLQRYNFAQPIADNGCDIIIMQKIKGTEHSISYWAENFIDIQKSETRLPSKEQAELFLEQITKIADFPLESFVDLANKIKYISQKMLKFDHINPNNMLIDYDSERFNPIDLQYKVEFAKYFTYPYNTAQDMICSLCDSLLNVSYIKALDEPKAQELIDKTTQVIKKCKLGAEIAGLEDGRKNIDIVNKKRMDKDFSYFIGKENHISKLYAEFCTVYKDVL